MIKVTEVHPLPDYKVKVSFSDGVSAELDMKPFIKGGMSDSLRDIKFFNQVKVDDFSGVSWPNGFDFCPKFLWQLAMQGQGKAVAYDATGKG